jgi:hypothetical protein
MAKGSNRRRNRLQVPPRDDAVASGVKDFVEDQGLQSMRERVPSTSEASDTHKGHLAAEGPIRDSADAYKGQSARGGGMPIGANVYSYDSPGQSGDSAGMGMNDLDSPGDLDAQAGNAPPRESDEGAEASG